MSANVDNTCHRSCCLEQRRLSVWTRSTMPLAMERMQKEESRLHVEPAFCVFRGGSPRNRTLNLRIKSPLLYQLS